MKIRPAAATPTLLALALGSWCAGCSFVQDRFRSCGHLQVDLVNSDQSIDPVSILAESERPFAEAVLASGQSRRLLVCVERGDAKRFRAVRGGDTLAVANCVVSRARDEYEASVARVVWDPRGLVCDNW